MPAIDHAFRENTPRRTPPMPRSVLPARNRLLPRMEALAPLLAVAELFTGHLANLPRRLVGNALPSSGLPRASAGRIMMESDSRAGDAAAPLPTQPTATS